jgi:hypothetical protein
MYRRERFSISISLGSGIGMSGIAEVLLNLLYHQRLRSQRDGGDPKAQIGCEILMAIERERQGGDVVVVSLATIGQFRGPWRRKDSFR